jgi:hypothetical protein
MKTRKVILTSIVLFVCGICTGRVADGWKIRQVTNRDFINGIADFPIAISGDNLVWIEQDPNLGSVNFDGNQVFFSDGNSVTQISNVNDGLAGYHGLQISGTRVVWVESLSGTYQIMLWNGGTPIQISSGTGIDEFRHGLSISEGNVVWVRSISNKYQIMFWNGGTPIQISSGVNNCYDPQVSGTTVVWRESISGKDQIMFWNGGTPTRISSGTYSCGSPKISGSNVIWAENNKLMFWNGTSVTEIPDSNFPERYDISNSTVAWCNRWFVKAWDGNQTRTLWKSYKYIRPEEWCGRLSVSENHITWWEATSDSGDSPFMTIHYSDPYKGILLTDMRGCRYPVISGTNIAFLALDENYVWQIFLAQPDTGPHPEPLKADINEDKVVDMDDLNILASQWLREEENEP